MTKLLCSLLATLLLATTSHAHAASSVPVPEPPWAGALRTQLDAADARFPGEIGVYVHHIGRDESFSMRADESWYLASGIKVPVAITVMRQIEQGELALDTRIPLLRSDLVDGAGRTRFRPVGTPLRVAWLLEQMIIHSDNTATDVLIRVAGLEEVNAVAHELLTAQGVVITTLADVRRRAYGMLHVSASELSSQDLLALRQAGFGSARMQRLAQLLDVPRAEFSMPDLDSAFEAYYATEVNAAPLRDFGSMLATLSNELALGPDGTAYLLDLMSRVQTGDRRIKARLPSAS